MQKSMRETCRALYRRDYRNRQIANLIDTSLDPRIDSLLRLYDQRAKRLCSESFASFCQRSDEEIEAVITRTPDPEP